MMHIGNEFLAAFEVIADLAIKACKEHIECTKDPRQTLQPVSSTVRKHLGVDLVRRQSALIQFVKAALPYRDGAEFWIAKNGAFVPDYVKPGADEPKVQNECYVELLTGACLGLYFLGVPDGRPWDMVRTWAEYQGGGLPNGACVSKAIGDIVRGAFRAQRDAASGTGQKPGDLLMHSFLPMAIFPEIVTEKNLNYLKSDGKPHIPEYFHHLARSYEMLQFRRYANAGYPFLYSVPARFVCAHLRQRNKGGNLHGEEAFRASYDEVCANMRARLQEACPPIDDADKKRQRVVVLRYDRAPACFINDDAGLFTFEAIDAWDEKSAIPLPASYMRDDRRDRYYLRVRDFERTEKPRNMLVQDGDRVHDTVFHELKRCLIKMQQASENQSATGDEDASDGQRGPDGRRTAEAQAPADAKHAGDGAWAADRREAVDLPPSSPPTS
jgi:hypothetical protein